MSTKAAYQQKLQAQLDEWGAEIDKLQAKSDKVGADARIEYDQQIQKLLSMKTDAEQKMKNLKNAGQGAWEDLKTGLDSAWDALGRATLASLQLVPDIGLASALNVQRFFEDGANREVLADLLAPEFGIRNPVLERSPATVSAAAVPA